MHNRQTIIYIGGFELPDKNAAAQRVLSNAKIFRDLGFNVLLIGTDKTLSSNTEIDDTKSVVEGFETRSIPYPKNKTAWLKYITSAAYIKRIIEQIESPYAIVCYNYPAVAMYRIHRKCQKKNIYCLADVTEWYENSGGGFLFNTIKWADTSLRMHYVHTKLDGIISVSSYLTDFYNKKKCLTVELPTLYDVEKLKYIPLDDKEDTTIRFMYAGSAFNLERVDKKRSNIKDRLDKIISTFTQVYKYQNNFKLDIYGLSKENYLSVFPEHTEALQTLKNHIFFHGRQPHSKIVEELQKSDFSIFIRHIDRVIEAGFPSKFSESISYGTPVIANIISNIEPFMIEGKNSYSLPLNDEEARIQKIISILKLDKNQLVEMKKYCRENKIFDYRKYLEPVKAFLKKVGE